MPEPAFAPRVIPVTDRAFRLLRAQRRGEESYSQIIERLCHDPRTAHGLSPRWANPEPTIAVHADGTPLNAIPHDEAAALPM